MAAQARSEEGIDARDAVVASEHLQGDRVGAGPIGVMHARIVQQG